MSDLADVLAAVTAGPGRTADELRDALRARGRVSMTTADVARVLESNPRRFHRRADADPGRPVRWWLAAEPAAAVPPVPVGGRDLGPALYRWQVEALGAWRARRGRGVVEAVTGTGKTMVGVVAVGEELARGGQAAVLVPTRDLLHQWRSVLAGLLPPGARIGLVGDGHRDDLGHCDVVVAVANSARTADLRPRRPGGLLVADECHRYGSDENRHVLRDEFPRRLGLSATYARSDDAHLDRLDPYFGGTCFRMGYRQAITEGVLAPFHVALVGVRFSDDEYAEYDDLGVEMARNRSQLLRSGAVRSEPIGAFLVDVARCARGGSALSAAAMGYLSAMAERRRLLAETPAKLDALAAMSGTVAHAKRTIVFTQSIVGAEQAAQLLADRGFAAEALHSGLDRARRRDRLARFLEGGLTVLCAPTVLDEGVDVPAADLAVILAASRSRRQMVQRMGRVLRRKPDGRHAGFVVVYVAGTNEDPASGAHEGFLDEVAPVARSMQTCPPEAALHTPWSGAATVVR